MLMGDDASALTGKHLQICMNKPHYLLDLNATIPTKAVSTELIQLFLGLDSLDLNDLLSKPEHKKSTMIRRQRAILNRRIGHWRTARSDYINLWTEEEKLHEEKVLPECTSVPKTMLCPILIRSNPR